MLNIAYKSLINLERASDIALRYAFPYPYPF